MITVAAIVNTAKINKSHNKYFQLAIVLFLDKKFKIYILGGGEFPKGGDIPRIFAPLLRGGESPVGGGQKSCDTSIYTMANMNLDISQYI